MDTVLDSSTNPTISLIVYSKKYSPIRQRSSPSLCYYTQRCSSNPPPPSPFLTPQPLSLSPNTRLSLRYFHNALFSPPPPPPHTHTPRPPLPKVPGKAAERNGPGRAPGRDGRSIECSGARTVTFGKAP